MPKPVAPPPTQPAKPAITSANATSCTQGSGTLSWTVSIHLSNGASGSISKTQTDPSTRTFAGSVGGHTVDVTVYAYSVGPYPYCVVQGSSVAS